MALKRTSINLSDATQAQARDLTAWGHGNVTAIVRTAIDRMHQQERRVMEKRIMVEFSEDGLFGGWSDMDQYDVEASKRAYGDALEAALVAAHPDADVEVVSGINDRVELDGRRDSQYGAVIGETVAEVYQSYGWVRFTEAGIREAIPGGLWLRRADGVVVSVGEVEDDGTALYQMSFHRGEMPAHETQTYATIDETMEAITYIDSDWAAWSPRTD